MARTVEMQQGRPYPAVPPPDESQPGIPAPAPESSGPVERGSGGRVKAGASAKALGSRGGREAARRKRDLAGYGSSLGLGRMLTLAPDEHIEPFVRIGESWMKAQCEAVARDVGGGQLSPGVVAVLRSASWQKVFADYLFDCATRHTFAWDLDEARKPKVLPRTELLGMASRLADGSRQNLLAAHHLAVAEAAARPKTHADPMARIRALAEGRRR